MLSKLKDLISELKNDEQILRFKELENIIDHNKSIRVDFNKLLDLQKIMVGKEYRKESNIVVAKENYEKQLSIVMNYPIIEEYLDLLEHINSDLLFLRSIIEQEIAKDFD